MCESPVRALKEVAEKEVVPSARGHGQGGLPGHGTLELGTKCEEVIFLMHKNVPRSSREGEHRGANVLDAPGELHSTVQVCDGDTWGGAHSDGRVSAGGWAGGAVPLGSSKRRLAALRTELGEWRPREKLDVLSGGEHRVAPRHL